MLISVKNKMFEIKLEQSRKRMEKLQRMVRKFVFYLMNIFSLFKYYNIKVSVQFSKINVFQLSS